MSDWTRPDIDALRQVIRSSRGKLLLCSPFVRRDVLETVQESLPVAVDEMEIWTKLDFRDWLVGASEPDAILDLVDDSISRGRAVSVFQGNRLHAKVVISNGPTALAGSANLTMGGYLRNQELIRRVDGKETDLLRGIVNGIRDELVPVPREQLRQFVTQCQSAVDTQEALLQLIRDEVPISDSPALVQASLISYPEFWDFLERSTSGVAKEVLDIAMNRDRNNNTGKVKQAYFGIQRFLQEYPEHQAYVETLDDNEWFDVRGSHLLDDWKEFLGRFEDEADDHHQYSIRTLRGYLPVPVGGRLSGGGGGENQLKRVWPFVGRIRRDYQTP